RSWSVVVVAVGGRGPWSWSRSAIAVVVRGRSRGRRSWSVVVVAVGGRGRGRGRGSGGGVTALELVLVLAAGVGAGAWCWRLALMLVPGAGANGWRWCWCLVLAAGADVGAWCWRDGAGGVFAGGVAAGGVSAGGVAAGGVSAGGVSAGGVSAGGVAAGRVSAGGGAAGGVTAGDSTCSLAGRLVGRVRSGACSGGGVASPAIPAAPAIPATPFTAAAKSTGGRAGTERDGTKSVTTAVTLLSFTLDSCASQCFFCDHTTVTPLSAPVLVALADPSSGPTVARSSTTLPCPAVPSGFLTGLYIPSFSQNLVAESGQVSASPQVAESGQVIASPLVAVSSQVATSSQVVASCSCRLLSGLSRVFPSLPPSLAPPCTPCVTGHLRATPHSSSLRPATAPFQTLHLDVHYGVSSREETEVTSMLIRWLLATKGTRGSRVRCLHSDCEVRYAVHQLNLWHSDARPRVTPVSLWTGSPGVAADFHVWSSLAHVHAPGANKLSSRTRACVFLGFPLDASGWVFYDLVTYQFFASQDVTFDKLVCYYRSHPHRGAVVEGEGTGAAGAGGVGPGGAGGVGVEVTPVEDTAALTRRPRPTPPLGFPSVPQFPPRSSLRPVAAEPGGVPGGGTGGPGGVGGGGAGSGGAGAGGTSTVAPTLRTVRFLTREQRLLRLEREERERFERAQQQQQQDQSQLQQEERFEEEFRPHQERVEQESSPQQQVELQTQQERVEDSQPQQERAKEEPQEKHQGHVPSLQTPEEAERQRLRLRDLPDPAPARLVCGPLPSPHVPPVQSLSSSQRTPRSPLSRAVSPEPRWSRYRADGLFQLVLRSRTPPPPVLPQPPKSSLTVFHDPLSNYLRASRPVISRVLSALFTHPTAPLSYVSALVTTVAGFASSHRLDCTAHLVSGPSHSL
ncbi:unnamed protein product, partial [Closterium sp. NIES-53]